jgi:hypothetical protein
MTTTQNDEDATVTFYKATRPDGTSFHDATTKWQVGKIVRHPSPDLGLGLCSAGCLHVSDAPGETLVGGSWPCRLFEVESRGEMIGPEDHKYGCTVVKVVRELPAWQVLGPNGEAVAALIERCKTLTYDEAKRLDAARYVTWDAARYAARYAAWYATKNAAWDAARDAAWDAARYAAWYAARDATWYAARDAAWNATWYATRDAAWDAARDAAWDAAWYAAWDAAGDAARYAARDATRDAAWDAARDAALALLVKDLITPEQFEILYGPWRSVMEP